MEKKYCSKCCFNKPVCEFHTTGSSKKKIHSYCIDCRRVYDQERAFLNKDRLRSLKKARKARYKAEVIGIIFSYLEKGCSNCNEKDIRKLEFNHIDPDGKLGNIGDATRFNRKFLTEELKKCVVLCANCHRVHTVQQFGHWSADWKEGDNAEKFINRLLKKSEEIVISIKQDKQEGNMKTLE